jgi:hypothetical protein
MSWRQARLLLYDEDKPVQLLDSLLINDIQQPPDAFNGVVLCLG